MEKYMEIEELDNLFKDETFEKENDFTIEERDILAMRLAFNEYMEKEDYVNASYLIDEIK